MSTEIEINFPKFCFYYVVLQMKNTNIRFFKQVNQIWEWELNFNHRFDQFYKDITEKYIQIF